MKTTTFPPIFLGLAILVTTAVRADDSFDSAYAPTPETAAVAVGSDNVETETVGKLKIQNIRMADRYGTIEEDRVQAMRSEIRYVPTGGEGYNLVDSSGSQGNSTNAHNDGDMKISSWKLFTW